MKIIMYLVTILFISSCMKNTEENYSIENFLQSELRVIQDSLLVGGDEEVDFLKFTSYNSRQPQLVNGYLDNLKKNGKDTTLNYTLIQRLHKVMREDTVDFGYAKRVDGTYTFVDQLDEGKDYALLEQSPIYKQDNYIVCYSNIHCEKPCGISSGGIFIFKVEDGELELKFFKRIWSSEPPWFYKNAS